MRAGMREVNTPMMKASEDFEHIGSRLHDNLFLAFDTSRVHSSF